MEAELRALIKKLRELDAWSGERTEYASAYADGYESGSVAAADAIEDILNDHIATEAARG